MRYGHFDDAAKEYVVDRPDTPRSWSNYLGSTEYGAIITNNAGGYSFYKSSALGRFLRLRFNAIPMDQPGRYFYLRDQDRGDFWSTSWQPVGKSLRQFKSVCRHGTGYTTITSRYRGIESEATYFVPLGRTFEVWLLKLTNTGRTSRRLSAFTYCEFTSNWAATQDLINLQFSQYCVSATRPEPNLLHIGVLDNLPENPQDFTDNDQGRWSFMGLVGAEVAGVDTCREAFIGPYRTYANPLVVEQGRCTGSLADGDNACGTFQADLALAPGESKEFMVLLGVGRAETTGVEILREFASTAKARAALAAVKEFWHARLGSLTCATPDPAFNSMVNVWNAYNAQITYAWSRAASLVYAGERDGLGYRDSLQDMLGVMAAIPDEAVKRLELLITGQTACGGAMPIVRPFRHRPGQEPAPAADEYRSDDCLWMFNAVPAYVKETGNLAWYNQVLPYADHGSATVLGHLRRALEFNLERTGAHGLPCGLLADWNDCLKLGFKGESIFVTFQVRYGLLVYRDICARLERPEEGAWAAAELAKLDAAIRLHTWDGKWFLRGWCEDGGKLGTAAAAEGQIFMEPQPWAVISGAATPEQAQTAMDSLHDRLATEFGIRICAPPFRETPHHVVRAVLLNGGMKENGGIFSHTQSWAVIAEAMMGRADRAWDYYRRFMPAAYNDRAEVRQIEPYVHCQSTHSPESGRSGASRIPWLSGTASWAYVAATQYLLGVRPDYDGLVIDPCLPLEWKEISVTRRFRGCEFRIRICNGAKGKGVKRLTLNGQTVSGNLLPLSGFAAVNDVVAELE